MNKDQLRAQLEHLHAELQRADALDVQQRELLQRLANHIHQLLNRNENQPHHYRSLGGRFSEDVAQLEASHPRITCSCAR
jgi:hypothetical protein